MFNRSLMYAGPGMVFINYHLERMVGFPARFGAGGQGRDRVEFEVGGSTEGRKQAGRLLCVRHDSDESHIRAV